MPRKYTKKSPYWVKAKDTAPKPNVLDQLDMSVMPAITEDTHYSAVAACGGGDVDATTYRDGASPGIMGNRFKNINSGLIPFDIVNGNTSCSSAITAVYRAYYNVAVLRNAINMMTDFSASKIHVKTSNKALKNAITNWLKAINVYALQAQFFLEYYRSGNVFIYAFNGRIPADRFAKLQEALSARSPSIPIRYTILNPMQVYLQTGAGYPNVWTKMLSTFEIARLKNPQTDEDRQVFNGLPEDIKKQIKSGGGWQYLFIPLDNKRLSYAFYKKQDYEPMAVPMAYPVLNDIEFKLELKRMDMTAARMMEQALLLVTTGMPRDQYNKGLNPESLTTLQNIFRNQTVGRVLVADWTTKAQWVIPDLKTLLGTEKYARVDQDIREGLQYMFFGDEKFANASIKVKILIESLKEGRRTFMDFLNLEVSKICEAMNFKNVPKLEMEEIDLQDSALMSKLYVQMAQLGMLTADETNVALKTGILPDKDTSLTNQKEYKDARDKGMYLPLVGGEKKDNGMGGGSGRPTGSKAPQTTKSVSPIGTNAKFSGKAIVKALSDLQGIKEGLTKAAKKQWKLKELNEAQADVLMTAAKSIFINESAEDWDKATKQYLTEPKLIPDDISQEIDEIALEHDMDLWAATVLYKARIPHKND